MASTTKIQASKDRSVQTPDVKAVATDLRNTVGRFVRAIRGQSGTSTTAQSEVLAQLERYGPASVAMLAEARGVKHQSMRLVVSRLTDLGLLELKPNTADRRCQLVSLTSKGRKDVEADRTARSAFLAELLTTRLSSNELVLISQAIKLLERLSIAE
jgi:DNA-binding MarR family transcriptional regulator